MKDCVSLEVAQKLQRAGYKSECDWFYNGFGEDINNLEWELKSKQEYILAEPRNIPAPTATQLAEELPMRLKYNIPGLVNDATLVIWKLISENKNTFSVFYEGDFEDKEGKYHPTYEVIPRQIGTLPDALGLMMVYLLDNKLI